MARKCDVDGCLRDHSAKGFCGLHYTRWKNHGDPLREPRQMPPECTIEGCGKKYFSRGLCSMHYARVSKHGNPDAGPVKYSSPDEALAKRSERRGECIVWTGPTTKGYGVLHAGGYRGYVHRFAWERANGSIPEGMVIDHTCYTALCVNPAHLRLATVAENGRNRSGASVLTKSGVRGVYPRGEKWVAQVGMLGKSYYLGTFDSIESASDAVECKRRELFGNYAGRS